jgi:hypothetical protein
MEPESAPSIQAEQELNRLAKAIQDLRVDYERFFNGALQIPPEEQKTAIQRHIRRLRNANLQGAAETFRLGSLEARFNSLNELYTRRLRDHEEGRGRRSVAAGASSSGHDVGRGVVLDESVNSGAVQALYTGLQRRPGEGPQFDLDSFRSYLRRQVSREVQFRVLEEDGKMKLKAKPLRAEPSKGSSSGSPGGSSSGSSRS